MLLLPCLLLLLLPLLLPHPACPPPPSHICLQYAISLKSFPPSLLLLWPLNWILHKPLPNHTPYPASSILVLVLLNLFFVCSHFYELLLQFPSASLTPNPPQTHIHSPPAFPAPPVPPFPSFPPSPFSNLCFQHTISPPPLFPPLLLPWISKWLLQQTTTGPAPYPASNGLLLLLFVILLNLSLIYFSCSFSWSWSCFCSFLGQCLIHNDYMHTSSFIAHWTPCTTHCQL